MTANSNQSPDREKSRTNAQLDLDLTALIEKHEGRVRITTRDPTGKRKILTAMFGPRQNPSHQLEIEDFGAPSDPLKRDERMRGQREREHDARRLEISREVAKALAKQKREFEAQIAELKGEPTPGTVPIVQPVEAGERWSKASFATQLAELLGADDCALESDAVEPEIG